MFEGSARLEELNKLVAQSEEELTGALMDNTTALTNNIDAGGRAADALRGIKSAAEDADKSIDLFTSNLTSEQKGALRNVAKVIGGIGDVLSSIATIAKNNADKQIDQNDRVLNAKLAKEDEALHLELERAGLLEETKLEALEREADAAQEAADRTTDANQKRIYQETADEKRAALERFKLVEESEKKKLKLAKETARKNRDIAFDVAYANWELQVATSIASAAQGILTSLVMAGPAGAAIAAGLGIAQVAIIAKNPPEKPAFQTGGIVYPQNNGADVRVAENGHSETLFNTGPSGQAFQKQMAGHIAAELRRSMESNPRDDGAMVIQFVVDGRVEAERNARYYNDGIVKLEISE